MTYTLHKLQYFDVSVNYLPHKCFLSQTNQISESSLLQHRHLTVKQKIVSNTDSCNIICSYNNNSNRTNSHQCNSCNWLPSDAVCWTSNAVFPIVIMTPIRIIMRMLIWPSMVIMVIIVFRSAIRPVSSRIAIRCCVSTSGFAVYGRRLASCEYAFTTLLCFDEEKKFFTG